MTENKFGWLSLTLKPGEHVLIGDHTQIFFTGNNGVRAKIGILSPNSRITKIAAEDNEDDSQDPPPETW